jgi:hypothetical protein
MAVQVTVNNITGSTPYQVYVCDSTLSSCIYISQIQSANLPYNFIIPQPFENLVNYSIKIIDVYGCVITNTFTVN